MESKLRGGNDKSYVPIVNWIFVRKGIIERKHVSKYETVVL